MLIGIDKRFVFAASTKTASTSLEQVLKPHADIFRSGSAQRKHIGLPEIFPTYDFLFSQPGYGPDSFFKFGVMRDPFDWINSWYRYRLGNKVESPLPEGMSFADFWALKDWNILRGDGRKHLQRDMFLGSDGQLMADVIIPYDRLDDMFRDICAELEMPAGLPRANVSRIRETQSLPDGLEEEIRAFYADDYKLYAELDAINAEGMVRLRADRRAFRPVRQASGTSPGSVVAAPEGHVFVFSYCPEAGGSIQTHLNERPEFCIRGENNDAALHLMRSKNAVATNPEMTALRRSGKKTAASARRYGAEKVFPREYGRAMAAAFTQKVLKPEPNSRIAGFRSGLTPWDTGVLHRYVSFLSEHFENTRIVFVTRQHSDVAAANRDDPDRLDSIDVFYRSYRDAHPDRCHLIDYDLWQSDPQTQEDLTAFLGEG
ncbi:hypothetical protein [Ruegeria hyattellae]|uniref:hypothetical protein n=1 Tax=Ruegeria hyattellae TaxID=3233337 RepID=UPI00355B276D